MLERIHLGHRQATADRGTVAPGLVVEIESDWTGRKRERKGMP